METAKLTDLYEKIERHLGCTPYLLGGAPRDVFLGRTPRDYDFYLPPVDIIPELTRSLNLTDINVSDVYDEGISDLPIQCIVSAVYESYKIQLIILYDSYNRDEILGTFSCTLSKFWYNFETHTVNASNEARLAVSTKSLVFTPDVSQRYKTKILGYFPDYTVRNEVDIAYMLIEEAIDNTPPYYNRSIERTLSNTGAFLELTTIDWEDSPVTVTTSPPSTNYLDIPF